jgi:hypothetical protein
MLSEDEDLRAILGDRTLDSYLRLKNASVVRLSLRKPRKRRSEYHISLRTVLFDLLSLPVFCTLHIFAAGAKCDCESTQCFKVDARSSGSTIGRFRGKTEFGVFQGATPYPIALS